MGHRKLSLRGRWMAAVLACGAGAPIGARSGAALSHRSAAALHDLRRTPGGPIDVTAPGLHRIPGIRNHRVRHPHARDFTTVDGIPVTTVSRTLLDEAQTALHRRLIAMLEQAQRLGTLDPNEIEATIARSPGHHGIAKLRGALAELTPEPAWVQSEVERRLLELIHNAGLPAPQCNVYVEGELVDFYWPEHGLVVEVDSYAFHGSNRSFEADRIRDSKLLRAGIRVLRITDTRIHREPDAVAGELRTLLLAPPAAAWRPPATRGR